MSTRVETDFGPTLPELIRGLWRRLSPRGRSALVVGSVVAAAALGYYLHATLSSAGFSYAGPAAPAFSFDYRDLHRVPPHGDELVRLERRRGGGPAGNGAPGALLDRLTVSPVRLRPSGPSAQPVSTSLPLAAIPIERRAARELPGFTEKLEGRTHLAVDHGPLAYQVGFVARGDGGSAGAAWAGPVLIGKVLIVPEQGDHPRRGVAIELVEATDNRKLIEVARREPAGLLLNYPVRDLEQVEVAAETSGTMERPLRSFRLG